MQKIITDELFTLVGHILANGFLHKQYSVVRSVNIRVAIGYELPAHDVSNDIIPSYVRGIIVML